MKNILIVEDEFLIALDIQATIQELGWETADTAGELDDALSLAREKTFSAALLDINLGGMPSFAVAGILKERNVPFAFLTGYDREMLPQEFLDVPVLKKPFSRRDLARVLRELMSAAAS